ncbi:DMT family transporter [Rhizobium sp. CG4]|jgi:transporter family-2 protein|uniref:DMT family transporter n=1 Tax=Rhizobium sp. CG4 TaxID=2726075 RepID=UPI0020348977|nr:DMT family transporter [Rhizobium sp. CG4]MCM2454053.1 DMT family transporter [Rhizobium sp. CG4]
MILWISMAFAGGVFVALSRQINGRLSLSNSPLIASFWNHIVGFVVLTLLGLAIGGLLPEGAAHAPWYAFIGGPIGVVFIASGSWLIPRIGAVNTALLVISGQMVSGVVLDLFSNQPPKIWASALGVLLILAGMALTQRRSK